MTPRIINYLFNSKIFVTLYLLFSILITIGWMLYANFTEQSVMDSFWISGYCFLVPAIITCALLMMNNRLGFWFAIPTLLLQVLSFTSPDLSYSIASTAPALAGVNIAHSNFVFILSNGFYDFFMMNVDFKNNIWGDSAEVGVDIYLNFLPLAMISLLYFEWFSHGRSNHNQDCSKILGEE